MRVSLPNPDGTIDIEHQSHHFHIAMTDCTYVRKPDGSPDTILVATPMMQCTDPGSTYQVQSFIPMLGDDQAQLVHAFYLKARGGAASLAEAMNSIAQRVKAARAVAGG